MEFNRIVFLNPFYDSCRAFLFFLDNLWCFETTSDPKLDFQTKNCVWDFRFKIQRFIVAFFVEVEDDV